MVRIVGKRKDKEKYHKIIEAATKVFAINEWQFINLFDTADAI